MLVMEIKMAVRARGSRPPPPGAHAGLNTCHTVTGRIGPSVGLHIVISFDNREDSSEGHLSSPQHTRTQRGRGSRTTFTPGWSTHRLMCRTGTEATCTTHLLWALCTLHSGGQDELPRVADGETEAQEGSTSVRLLCQLATEQPRANG